MDHDADAMRLHRLLTKTIPALESRIIALESAARLAAKAPEEVWPAAAAEQPGDPADAPAAS